MKRVFCLQEHNAKVAGLHWDLRIGDNGVLLSWAIPKHRLPNVDERLLAIKTEDHPWEYKDFDGEISSGYGAGTVKLLFSGEVEVSLLTDTKIEFVYEGASYKLFPLRQGAKWLILRTK